MPSTRKEMTCLVLVAGVVPVLRRILLRYLARGAYPVVLTAERHLRSLRSKVESTANVRSSSSSKPGRLVLVPRLGEPYPVVSPAPAAVRGWEPYKIHSVPPNDLQNRSLQDPFNPA